MTRINVRLFDVRGQVAKDMEEMFGLKFSRIDVDDLLASLGEGLIFELHQPKKIKGRKKIR